jgi:bifunctional ADP-heptose synthase (sugar kinase/adenylyltransferase)
VGDFFLDKYLEIDPAVEEISVETGLKAHQVVNVRCYPGAAGTVVNNLVALGVGHIHTVGLTGADGEGFELRKGLAQPGVDMTHLLEVEDRRTPTYTKPMIMEPGQPPREIERLDIKNHSPLSIATENKLIHRMEQQFKSCEGMIVADQVEVANCGVITDRVREEIAGLGEAFPRKSILADSRRRIAQFRRTMRRGRARWAWSWTRRRPNTCSAISPTGRDGRRVSRSVREACWFSMARRFIISRGFPRRVPSILWAPATA